MSTIKLTDHEFALLTIIDDIRSELEADAEGQIGIILSDLDQLQKRIVAPL